MEPLCISDALELYQTLKPHLPEEVDMEMTALDFAHEVIGNMESNPMDYLETLMQVSGLSQEEIAALDIEESVRLFINGLIDNQVLALQAFGSKLGLNYGS